MFSRKACYFFVRPKKSMLEVCFFLGRTVKSPLVRRAMASSQTKVAHIVHVKHRDQVEAPVTDWLKEAYEVTDTLRARPAQAKKSGAAKTSQPKKRPAKKRPTKKSRAKKR
jgi:hypothetical protein